MLSAKFYLIFFSVYHEKYFSDVTSQFCNFLSSVIKLATKFTIRERLISCVNVENI